MTDKFKKADRQYVLSDSTVNEYGFRLLTSGYQIEAFQKNPIGYYMHKRDDGILLKWEDLCVEGDVVVGTPVINLSNMRGEQTCDEVANGFLNAASVGHIVVLEYSTDEALMLEGQTGPTITKWYNKECSLVDIPGNCNALTRLYDAQENELNLVDLKVQAWPVLAPLKKNTTKELYALLQLADNGDEHALVQGVQELAARPDNLQAGMQALNDDKAALLAAVAELTAAKGELELKTLLDRALEDRKLTVALRDRLAADYRNNIDGLKCLLATLPAYWPIAEQLKSKQEMSEAQWKWDDYEKNDPTGRKLKELRANDGVRYKELFDAKFF